VIGKGRSQRVIPYTPAATAKAEKELRSGIAQLFAGQSLMTGMLEIDLKYILPVPPSWPKWKRQFAYGGTCLYPTGKPDLDNLAKLTLDAMNGLVWRDDSQVCAATMSKHYGNEHEVGVRIRVREWGAEDGVFTLASVVALAPRRHASEPARQTAQSARKAA
jgi:Holliday junction resolvase RusA-like endonuclease